MTNATNTLALTRRTRPQIMAQIAEVEALRDAARVEGRFEAAYECVSALRVLWEALDTGRHADTKGRPHGA